MTTDRNLWVVSLSMYHYVSHGVRGGQQETICGRNLGEQYVQRHSDRVTCGSCIKLLESQGEAVPA